MSLQCMHSPFADTTLVSVGMMYVVYLEAPLFFFKARQETIN